MIADTTFLIHFHREGIAGQRGPARLFFAGHRQELVRTSIVSLSEIASGFEASWEAWEYFKRWVILSVHRGVAEAAAVGRGVIVALWIGARALAEGLVHG